MRRKLAGEIKSFQYEWIKFNITDGMVGRRATYTPDFMVVMPDSHIEFHEVKALWGRKRLGFREDAKVKLQVCASQNRQFGWKVVWRDNGIWKEKEV